MDSGVKLGRPHFLGLLVAATLLLAACGTRETGGQQTLHMAPAEQQVLNLRMPADVRTIDPHRANFQTDISIVKQLFTPLLTYDEDLKVVAGIASRVPTLENAGVSSDGKTYTLKIRDDLKWSDGKPLTAQDIVDSFQRLLDPRLASPFATNYYSIVGAREYNTALGNRGAPKEATEAELARLRSEVGVKALDATTVVFTLNAPQASFLNQLAAWAAAPVRKDIIEEHGDRWTEAGNLVGNGPFALKEWLRNQRFVLEPNAYWHGGKTNLRQVVVHIIEDDATAYAAYLRGDLDVTSVPAPSRREVTSPGSSLFPEVVRQADLATFAMMVNHSVQPWNNQKVRQAFAAALDREAFVAGILQGAGVPTTSWLPPGLPGYDASVGQQYQFNPDRARQLLAEAGYPDGQGMPRLTLLVVSNDMHRVMGQFIQDQFKKHLNVDVQLDLVDGPTFQSRFMTGQYSFTFISWTAGWPYPDNWLSGLFATGSGNNVARYSNARVDELLSRAESELDKARQLELYREAHKKIVDEAGVLPIYNREVVFMVKPRVQGLVFTGMDGAIRGDSHLWKAYVAVH
jgi:oligopeptide transport system substrate-binding protein